MAIILECKTCGIYYEGTVDDCIVAQACKDCFQKLQMHAGPSRPPASYIKYFGGDFFLGPTNKGVWYHNTQWDPKNTHYVSVQALKQAQQNWQSQYVYKGGPQVASPPPRRPRTYGSAGIAGSPPTPSYAQATSRGYNATPATAVQCSITWDAQVGAYNVNVPFQPNFIEFIKAKIPGSDRAWVPSTKTWVVQEKWLDVLKLLAEELWTPAGVTVTSRQAVEDALRQQQDAMRAAILASLPDKERAIFEFLELVSFDAVKACYRKAAMDLHPDRQGGDAEKMTRLNAAWTNVEKHFA